MKFGEYARKLRRKAGLSQNDVAKILGLQSGQMVSDFERGLCFPPLRKLDLLAEAYRTPLKIVFNRMYEEKRERDWKIAVSVR